MRRVDPQRRIKMTVFDVVALGLAVVVFVVPLIKRRPSRLVWALAMVLVLNVLTDLTYEIPAAVARGVLVPLRVGALLALVLHCLLRTRRHNGATKVMLVFLTYLAVLVVFTSNPAVSGEAWLRQFVLMLMFAAGFMIVRDIDRLRVLNVGLLASTGLLLLNFVLAQAFNFGYSPYQNEVAVYLGGGGIHLMNNLVYFTLIVPLLLILSRRTSTPYLVGIAAALSGVAILMVMKRITIVALGTSFLVYLFFAPRKERRILVLIGIVGVLGITSPLYIDTVIARGDRFVKMEVAADKQSRDWDRWTSDWQRSGYSPSVLFFGQELFLSADYFSRSQKIHVDYIALLHGAGVIGLTLYLIVFSMLFKATGIRGSPIGRLSFARELRAVAFALITACFIIGLSSGMSAITPRSLLFLYAGAIAGVLNQAKFWAHSARSRSGGRNWRRRTPPIRFPREGTVATMAGSRVAVDLSLTSDRAPY